MCVCISEYPNLTISVSLLFIFQNQQHWREGFLFRRSMALNFYREEGVQPGGRDALPQEIVEAIFLFL